MIQYFYFDLGNVLVHFDAMIACRNVARLIGSGEREVFEGLYGSGLEVAYEMGKMDDESFAEAFRTSMGAKCETGDLLREMSAMFEPNLEILPVIGKLQDAGIPLGILSNTCAAHWNWIQSQKWEVASGWYRDAVLSFEVGAMKPDPEIYRVAAKLAGVEPSAIFFTDDREENVQAAREAGWRAELFVDAERLMVDLFESV